MSDAPIYQQAADKTLTPGDHFVQPVDDANEIRYKNNDNDKSFFIKDHSKHFIRDLNEPGNSYIPVTHINDDGVEVPVFSGSTTNINPFDDPVKDKIITNGLENAETSDIREKTSDSTRIPPLSPLHPFTRMDPYLAQQSNLTTYNRSKLPVADLEFRKGFRHIFITRPECYIMSRDPKGLKPILSEQASYDEDFTSCYSRMPHILNLLSPIYVTGSFSQNGINSNMNYLLSNRVMGLSTAPTTNLTTVDSVNKSIEGYTVTPALNVETRQGSTLSLNFRDTKNLEVYEMLRMWMLYNYKRAKGIFSPPYNGYQYKNGFLPTQESGSPVGNSIIYHPYDRALEYGCTIFDIVTNESMTKIIYQCKYYGVYPIEATLNGLVDDKNNMMTEDMTVSSTFKYHKKLENVNKTLVEFNYNAGITDDLGRVNKSFINTSQPFLLYDNPEDRIMKQYIGAAGMFTGSPYIILGQSQNDPLNKSNGIITPYLQFTDITNVELNNKTNSGIVNVQKENTDKVIGIIS